MKIADPDCEQCGGRGSLLSPLNFSTTPCPCKGECRDEVKAIQKYIKDNYEPDLSPGACHSFEGTWRDRMKPKRKRHILKRKKRWALYTAADRALGRIVRHFDI